MNSFSTTFCHKDIMIRKNDYARSSDLTTELSHRTRVRRDSLDLNNVSKASRCWCSDIVAHLLITVPCILWSSVSGRSRSDSNEVLTSSREDLLLKNILIQIRSSFTTRLIASDLINTNVRRTLDATVFWLVSESVAMSSCQWMSNKFLIGEKLIENSYVLLWTGRVNFTLTNWLWTCHTSMCGDASCMTLQIYQKIWRYRGHLFTTIWGQIHVAEELVNLEFLRRKDQEHLVRGGLKRRKFNWDCCPWVRFNVHLPEIVKWFLKSSEYALWSERLFESSVYISYTSIYALYR